jgi:glutathione synthase/RimK-type ligase-like ATP-grasp enzyme
MLQALRDSGLQADMLAWDDPTKDPATYDLCVLRSAWNYYSDPDAFVAWVDRVEASTRLLNPAAIVHWNLHKGYLRKIAEAGTPIIQTAWFKHRKPADLAATMEEQAWSDVVIKPAISAASFRTQRFSSANASEGQAFLEILAQDGDAMVQKYMTGVESPGERALVFIDGEFTHAVIKRPRLADEPEKVTGAVTITPEEESIAHDALACVAAAGVAGAKRLLYGRVDVVNDDTGRPVVSEVELMEPSLFLLQHPPAMKRFVKAINRECAAGMR